MAKAATSRTVSTKKSREKRRRIRAKAKESGENISLSESKRRAGGIEAESLEKKPTTQTPVKEKKKGSIILLGSGKETIERKRISRLSPEEFKKEEGKFKLKQAGKAALVGAGIGAAAFFGGTALAARGAAGATIKVSSGAFKSIQSKLLANQISRRLGTFGRGPFGMTGVAGKGVNFVSKTAPAARNFATNTKTISLTKKILIGAGISLGVVSIAKDILGTYPFASFGKEETLQSLSFTFNKAIDNGLLEEAQGLLDASNEIINAAPTIMEKIPYVNVQKEFQRYIAEQGEVNKVWQAIIDKKLGEVGQESDFARERRESDEAAFERKREFGAEETERFEGIREEGEERERAEAEAESERFAGIREENTRLDNEEKRLNSIFFRLIREGKNDEAEEFRRINFPT
jgi:hypothetical protein